MHCSWRRNIREPSIVCWNRVNHIGSCRHRGLSWEQKHNKLLSSTNNGRWFICFRLETKPLITFNQLQLLSVFFDWGTHSVNLYENCFNQGPVVHSENHFKVPGTTTILLFLSIAFKLIQMKNTGRRIKKIMYRKTSMIAKYFRTFRHLELNGKTDQIVIKFKSFLLFTDKTAATPWLENFLIYNS